MLIKTPSFSLLLKQYQNIYFISSPPRCGSTAFARVFWEHPTVRYYSHEPFEVTYYDGQGLDAVHNLLSKPLDISSIKNSDMIEGASSLVIKEMPYQVGKNFGMAASWAKQPIVFLIRDPRLNILSRIMKKKETGDSIFFPLQETGWELIQQQIAYCDQEGIDYLIVDASDFRNHPEIILPQVFERLGLSFSNKMLNWQSAAHIEIDNLDGSHSHLYRKVLSSKGIRPADEPIPPIEDFTTEHGIREHVLLCMDIYKALSENSHRLKV